MKQKFCPLFSQYKPTNVGDEFGIGACITERCVLYDKMRKDCLIAVGLRALTRESSSLKLEEAGLAKNLQKLIEGETRKAPEVMEGPPHVPFPEK